MGSQGGEEEWQGEAGAGGPGGADKLEGTTGE